MAMISPNSRGSGKRPSGQMALLYGSTRPHLQVLNSYLSSQAKDCREIQRKNKIFTFPFVVLSRNSEEVTSSFQVVSDFISIEEEEILMKEVEPHFKRLQYEFDHWDDAIHGFREIERGRWVKVLRLLVHILDLAKTGVIKPHVDSVRFCGNIISGVCLLSDAVMRLVHVNNKDQVIDVMLPKGERSI
ncbi:alpha-ketoglutarate-dependent dioxygenase alkB homolog 7, mitochondrial-like [Macrobrachium nipponense]|uniref:alpha-ketoglutarate-dependent dioxygenase alkB homolog 7, mitochondrial-like n=1 Tax=Macrobrachium nipponense TaxID=159736 RepID=UPI0030C8CDBE